MTAPAPIAVVIPTYNHALFLGEAIDSVVGQTITPAEIIVVDDGSTDKPEEVVSRHASVQLIRQDNCGLAAARNSGWRATSSPFVAFLDADDWLRPDALKVGLEQLEHHPDAALTYGAYANHYWPSGRIVPALFRPVPMDAFAAFLRVNPVGMHGAVLYRRTALEAVGGFAQELRACEDYDLYLRLAQRYAIACSPELIADYRQHESNMSRDQAFMLRAVLRVMRRMARSAHAQGLADDWQIGVRDWKHWYVENWARDLGYTGLTVDAVRQGLELLLLAPRQMIGKLGRGARRRIRSR